jgi:hypothetical protein
MDQTLYPVSPAVDKAQITQISARYRQLVLKVMFSIAIFLA